ncbi:hypothetical protein ACLOJK_030066 [Asimina triloba]
MPTKRMLCFLLVTFSVVAVGVRGSNLDFIYEGFSGARAGANLSLSGNASITNNGILKLTDSPFQKGHACYPIPLRFAPSHGKNISFSTAFVFAISSPYGKIGGTGAALVISPSKDLPGSGTSQYLGIFNSTNNGDSSNHIVAIELDTFMSLDLQDIDDNHVGVDVNGVKSVEARPAAYFDSKKGNFKNLSLKSGEPMNAWVEYDGEENQLNVTIFPIDEPKPDRPLISMKLDLLSYVLEDMYVGFSAATALVTSYHYILGWSFETNGNARQLHPPRLPKLPRTKPKSRSKFLEFGVPVIVPCSVFMAILGVVLFVRRQRKFAEVTDDWETEYGTHRFSYKDLFMATRGFANQQLLGVGGFGRVYHGILPSSKKEVAVKRVSHDSRQGMREFIAEIASLGRLRHRNLVQLLGYCRRKTELLLVYDFMPNRSLDKFLFEQPNPKLSWSQRFRIIKGVASGLLYLHEEWELVVLHRDIKASNVLLDSEMNGRLGDFGLARLYDHGTDPQTTHIVGTLGYLAPEISSSGKATTRTDVFAFGAFMLEVACGRRPIDHRSSSTDESNLVYWVWQCWKKGKVVEAADATLGGEYDAEEMELVLKIGLLCSNPCPAARPSMRQVMQYLDGDVPSTDLSWENFLAMENYKGFGGEDGFSYPSSLDPGFTSSSSMLTASILSGGR